MSKIKKQILTVLSALILIFTIIVTASASAGGGTQAVVMYTGQTVDTITFRGVTVAAKYALGGGYGRSEYSCAALVMKFYKAVYGFDVWNLSSSGSTPTCSNGEYFTQTDTPRVGDIVRFQDRTHWALVKQVRGNTVTLIEQNWGYHSSQGYVAAIDRTVQIGDGQVSFFTYSAYESVQKHNTSASATNYSTWESAMRAANIDGCEQVSIESVDNLRLVAANEQIETALTQNSTIG